MSYHATKRQSKRLSDKEIEKITRGMFPRDVPMAYSGGYSLDLYCDHNNDGHGFRVSLQEKHLPSAQKQQGLVDGKSIARRARLHAHTAPRLLYERCNGPGRLDSNIHRPPILADVASRR